MRKLRVLHLGKYYHPYKGGFEASLYTLVNETEDNLSVRVLASHTRPKTVIERTRNSTVVRLANFGRIFSQPLTPAYFFWLRSLKCDIVHLHLPHPLAMLSYLAASPRAKLIVSYHNDIIRPRWAGSLLRPLLIRVLKRASVIVVASGNLINSSGFLMRFREKCTIIPYGIDIGRFKVTPGLLEESRTVRDSINKPIILFVGRLVYYKGLKYLIKAMKDIDAKLIIIGDGDEKNKLKLYSSLQGVNDKILWLGRVPDDLLPAYYHACDIFVLPSCYNSESFGLVILEAHACAKPVVSTNLPTGVSFANLHEKTGLVVSAGSSPALAGALNHLLGSRELREAYGANGRLRVEREFGKEIMAQRFLNLYGAINPLGNTIPA